MFISIFVFVYKDGTQSMHVWVISEPIWMCIDYRWVRRQYVTMNILIDEIEM